MKFADLEWKKIKIDIMWFALNANGMCAGTDRAICAFPNDYKIQVTKGSYLCTKGTYEVGILAQDKLLKIEEEFVLNSKILALGLKNDGSGDLVYKEVTEEQIDKVLELLEKEEKYGR